MEANLEIFSHLCSSTLVKLKIEHFLILKVLNPLRCENETTQTVPTSYNSRKATTYHLGKRSKWRCTVFPDHFIVFKVNYLQAYTFLGFRVFSLNIFRQQKF